MKNVIKKEFFRTLLMMSLFLRFWPTVYYYHFSITTALIVFCSVFCIHARTLSHKKKANLQSAHLKLKKN